MEAQWGGWGSRPRSPLIRPGLRIVPTQPSGTATQLPVLPKKTRAFPFPARQQRSKCYRHFPFDPAVPLLQIPSSDKLTHRGPLQGTEASPAAFILQNSGTASMLWTADGQNSQGLSTRLGIVEPQETEDPLYVPTGKCLQGTLTRKNAV